MLIGVLTDSAIGGTFLTWSLHYLAGHTDYYSAYTNNKQQLTSNPLTLSNAHGFVANHPGTLEEFNFCLENIISQVSKDFTTLYMSKLATVPTITTPKCAVTSAAVSQLQSAAEKIIVLYTSTAYKLYFTKDTSRVLTFKLNSTSEFYKTDQEVYQDFIDTYFTDSQEAWGNITSIWDKREFLALNMRPHTAPSVLPDVDLSQQHFRLDSIDLYTQFESTVESLFKYLDVQIYGDRLTGWIEIYRNWQKLHSDRILFAEYFEDIVSSIVNNYYLDLTRFNLDLTREAAIQHELIYKYGLTIQGWGVEKFPTNTQDIHKLLEPNTYHTVDNIYGLL